MEYIKHTIILILYTFIFGEDLNQAKISLYNYNAVSIDGDTIYMSDYKEKLILIVNVA